MMNNKFHEIIKQKLLTLISLPSRFPQYFNIDLHDLSRTIFLVGSARSGTTWLQEIINFDNKYRIMFEPFHPKKVELIHDWKYFQYLRIDEKNPKYILPMKAILSGNVHNRWVDKYNKKLLSQYRLIKSIHSHLFLYWMKQNFPGVPIIFLLRHPCAVANSRMYLTKEWFKPNINVYLQQNQLIEDYLFKFKEKIKAATSDFEKYIFKWCIENYVPIRQFKDNEVLITFYENLCLHPQVELKRIFSFIGRSYNGNLEIFDKPSKMSMRSSAINSRTDLMSSWRINIDQDQVQKAVEILEHFGLDQIYNEDDLPLLHGDKILNLSK